jgi:RES domain-containing protein
MRLHPETDRLRTALERCKPCLVAWSGELFRSASPKYANKDDLITGAGSKAAGARWNPPGSFHTVYASLEVETAVAEALQHFRHYGLPVSKAMPRVIVAIEAKLERVLDLRDGGVRRALRVSEKRMLSEPWREEQKRSREALTQALARLRARHPERRLRGAKAVGSYRARRDRPALEHDLLPRVRRRELTGRFVIAFHIFRHETQRSSGRAPLGTHSASRGFPSSGPSPSAAVAVPAASEHRDGDRRRGRIPEKGADALTRQRQTPRV